MLKVWLVLMLFFSFSRAEWVSSLKPALELGKKKESPVLIFLWRQGCPACAYMERTIQSNPQVKERVDRIVVAHIDLNSPEGRELGKKYRVLGTPHFVFYNPVLDKELGSFSGAVPPALFTEILNNVCAESKLKC